MSMYIVKEATVWPSFSRDASEKKKEGFLLFLCMSLPDATESFADVTDHSNQNLILRVEYP